jgi:AraC-like DNA-binding protein
MRLPRVPAPPRPSELPLWPPLLATRGPGSRSGTHAHHALHFVLCYDGELTVTSARGTERAAGVLTAPDVEHAIDASGREVLLVFLDPESDVGAALARRLGGSVRLLDGTACRPLLHDADPMSLMRDGGDAWARAAVDSLGAEPLPPRRMHPRVRKVLRMLREPTAETGLDALARAVDLSPDRLLHVFTASIGIPLRPYLAWLRLQRAAAAVAADVPLAKAAHAAGFADAAHMTRTFRRMLGAPPSALRASARL